LSLLACLLSLLAGLYLFLPMTEAASAALLRWYKPRLAGNEYTAMVNRTFLATGPVALCLTLGTLHVSALVIVRRIRKQRKPRFWRRVPANTIAVMTIGFSLPVLALWIVEMSHLYGSPYRNVFIQRCGACHERQRPLDFFQSEAGWKATIRIMEAKHGALMEKVDAEQVVSYLLKVRSIPLSSLAQGRCSRCHPAPGEGTIDASRTQVLRSIERLRSLDARFMEPGEAIAMAAYYASHQDTETVSSNDLRDRFERYCEVCHYLDIALEPLQMGDWRQTLIRMQQKVPGIISEKEVLELEPWIQREVTDPERFLRQYPHSTIRDAWEKP